MPFCVCYIAHNSTSNSAIGIIEKFKVVPQNTQGIIMKQVNDYVNDVDVEVNGGDEGDKDVDYDDGYDDSDA